MKHRGTRVPKEKETGRRCSPDARAMRRLINRCGIHLNSDQLTQLWRYHQLLRQHDAQLNLTRVRNFEKMVIKLYADSMLPAIHCVLPSPLLDLGTGPGMPGIPLKIIRPDLHILLAESRKNRCAFLQKVVGQLGLDGLDVVDRGIASDFDRPVAGVITRAVEPMAETLARVSGCLEKNGRVIFMKGPHCDEELDKAIQAFGGSYARTEDISYEIPRTPHRRRLIIFSRTVGPRQAGGIPDPRATRRIKIIQSERNAIFTDLKKLHSGRGVKKQGRTLVCGKRLVAEGIQQWPHRCLAWISSGQQHAPPEKASALMAWYQLSPDLFRTLDLFNTKRPLLLFRYAGLPPWDPSAGSQSGCSLLIPFQDPDNVGAVIRSAVAFDVDRIVLLAESANPFHPKAVRASAGTVFSARLFRGPSLSELPSDLPVLSLASSGKPLAESSFPDSFCLLTGMEGPGLPPKMQAKAISIPMASGVESLNAATATAIALYAWQQKARCESHHCGADFMKPIKQPP